MSVSINLEMLRVAIRNWKCSPYRKWHFIAERYYLGNHDIYDRSTSAGKWRYGIGHNGVKQEIDGLPNSLIVDNIYSKMVDQKTNYLFAKPLLIRSENKEYQELLSNLFGREFLSIIKELATDFINFGIGWLYVYYNEEGMLKFYIFKPYEILPFWKDQSHKELDFVVRVYTKDVFDGTNFNSQECVDVYTKDGIQSFILDEHMNMTFVSDVPYVTSSIPDFHFNWGQLPIICFKGNTYEVPLIQRCKSIQDSINTIQSVFMDNMVENQDTSIIVMVGYDNTEPDIVRHNMTTYRLVGVSSDSNSKGDVKTLQMEVNGANFEVILKLFRKALVENCRGYDMKDDKVGGNNINEMNIKSMYIDMDLDANNIETEFQSSFYRLLYFINKHLESRNGGSFTQDQVTLQINRDTIVNEESQAQVGKTYFGTTSFRTYLKKMGIQNPDDEIKQMKAEGVYEAILQKMAGNSMNSENEEPKKEEKESEEN